MSDPIGVCDWCEQERPVRRVEANQQVCALCIQRKHAKCLEAYAKVAAVLLLVVLTACGREPTAPAPPPPAAPNGPCWRSQVIGMVDGMTVILNFHYTICPD